MSSKQWLGALLFAVLIAAGAAISFRVPGTQIPQTGQTIVVVLAGAFLGFNAATIAILAYLLMGVAGLPVFSGGQSGIGVLFGPSGGYLIGFWFAAGLIGYLADRKKLRRPAIRLLLWMLAAHVLILLIGAGLLSFSVGTRAAWFNGIQPFIVGALVKSLLAAAIVWLTSLIIQRQ